MTPQRREYFDGHVAAEDWMVPNEVLRNDIAYLLAQIDNMQVTIDGFAESLDAITNEAARHLARVQVLESRRTICRCLEYAEVPKE
jgi:hypothetical protein